MALLNCSRQEKKLFVPPVDRRDAPWPRIHIIQGGRAAVDSFRVLAKLANMACIDKPGIVAFDEFQDMGFTEWDARQMETRREQKKFFWTGWQSPPAADELRDRYFQANMWQSWSRCGSSEVAKLGAESLAAMRDSMKIHHTETRYRQVHDGYDWERLESESEGHSSYSERDTNDKRLKDARKSYSQGAKSWRKQPIARYREEKDRISHYMSLAEQDRELQSELMRLMVGQRFLGTWDGVVKEYVPMKKPPYPLLLKKSYEQRFEEHLERMKEELPWYRVPEKADAAICGAATRMNGRRQS